MFHTIFSTLISIPYGYSISFFVNNAHIYLYNTNISTNFKYTIITIITFNGFLYGYTGNDLITTINNMDMKICNLN